MESKQYDCESTVHQSSLKYQVYKEGDDVQVRIDR
jgi:hypothetical protein